MTIASSLGLLLQGVLVGIAIAAPVGPVAVMCIRRTITRGFGHGVATGLGAASADAIFAAIACFGLAAIGDRLLASVEVLELVGGIALVAMGVVTMRRRPPARDAGESGSLAGAFASALALTITNPFTILGLTALLAGFGIVDRDIARLDATVLLAGITAGATLWWGFLVVGSRLVAEKFDQPHLVRLNQISGAVIVLFGLAALIAWAL